jgi:hypothetical protein
MTQKPKTTQKLKRGVPLLPSLFTVGNLFLWALQPNRNTTG